MAISTERLQVSPWQEKVLTTPQSCDLAALGGAGSSKTFAGLLLIVRHLAEHPVRARALLVRKTYKALIDAESTLDWIMPLAFGRSASYNRSEKIWRSEGGATLELGQLETDQQFQKFMGRSQSLIVVDEVGEYPTSTLPDRLRRGLRAAEGMPTRMVLIGNPGSLGHWWLARRFALKMEPWQPTVDPESQRTWVYCPSTIRDNPYVNQEEYIRQLKASCAHDPELLDAWLNNNWAINRGAVFAGCLGESRNAIANWQPGSIDPEAWDLFFSGDWGSSSPACILVVARSPGAWGPDRVFYPRGSILLLDELATNEPGSLTEGMRYTVPRVAEEIHALAQRWRMRADGCIDDACFARHGSEGGSIADEFRRCDVYFQPAGKGDRRHGWEIMRRMLADAGQPDRPGLYVARRCEYFWLTTPFLSRDPRRPDDVDSRGPDHSADACRYALTFERPGVQIVPIQLGGSFR